VLSAPVVLGPLTPCSEVVRVDGWLPGATVRVLATSWATGGPLTRVVGEDALAAGDPGVRVTGGQLERGERVTAEQRTASDSGDPLPPELGVEVLAEPDLEDLRGLFAPETPLECGRCLAVAGTEPGATVSLQVNGDPPLSADTAADTVKFTLPGGQRLYANDSLVVWQDACGMTGGRVDLVAPLAQPSEGTTVGPLRIAEPLMRCQAAVHVEDVVPGATVVIELDGTEHRACFAYRRGWFWLPRPLEIGDEVRARQELELCEVRSEPRRAPVTERVPPPPAVIGPVCEGDRVVRVGGLVAGALVELAVDGDPLCRGAAAGAVTRFGVPSLLGAGELTARQALCGEREEDWSAWSAACPVRPLGPQPELRIVEPLIEGGVAVGVRATDAGGVARGTFVQVVGRRGVIGEGWGNGDERVDVALWSALRRGDRIHLRTLRCGASVDGDQEVEVGAGRDLGGPTVADPACDCGGSVLVRQVTPGAVVEVIGARAGMGLGLLGTARAGDVTVSVDVPALRAGDVLHASQRMGGMRSSAGPGATAPAVPHWSYVGDSAFRLGQLTQDADPAGRPHAGPTTPMGVEGTDLGIPVEHRGVLYLLFGDCREAPDIEPDDDPIAWLTTADPDDLETAAPDLHWIVGANGKFRPLTVESFHPLGNFEVPTGAFSYDGRLYVFIGVDKREDPEPLSHMTSSRLIAADHPGQDFVLELDVSSSSGGQILVLEPDGSYHPAPYPGGRWMVHVSPTVVRNADWPGLPASSGDGLLMFGSSAYRGYAPDELTDKERGASNVYLAWAPLTPGVKPPHAPIPQPQDWQFLVGRTNADEPVWETLAGGGTPMPLLPADPGGPRLLGEISAVWYPALRRWVLAGSVDAPVQMARQPWGPWTTSDALCVLWRGDRDAGNLDPATHWNDANVCYAPYLIGRWLRWDRSTRQATLYFTLSGFDDREGKPQYQPQLVRSGVSCWS
jgi:hypothetical protein